MNAYDLALTVANEINLFASFETEEVKGDLATVALAAIEADVLLHASDFSDLVFIKTAVGLVYRSYIMGGIKAHISQVSTLTAQPAAANKKVIAYKVQHPENQGLARFEVFMDSKEADLVKKATLASLRAKHTRDRSLLPLLNLLQSGSTPEQAAGRLGVSIATIGNWMHHLAE